MAFLTPPRAKLKPAPHDRADIMVGADIEAEADQVNNHGERTGSLSRGATPDPRPLDEEQTARETQTVRMGNTRPVHEQQLNTRQAGNVHAQVLRPVRGAFVAPQDSPPVPLTGWQRIRRNYPTQSWDAGTEQG